MIQSIQYWALLASTPILYWLLPERFRLVFLAIASFSFLSYVDSFSTLTLFIGSCGLKFFWDFRSEEKSSFIPIRWIVVALICWMCVFKALPNLLEKLFGGSEVGGLLIPLGLSYYIFKLIHYNVERSRGKFNEIDYSEYLCWLFLFPTFSAGPIEQLEHFTRERSRSFDLNLFLEGIARIMQGLIKKLVFADLIVRETLMSGHTMVSALSNLDSWPFWQVWAFLILLYLFFYLEFSAYSDIAIGGSRLFGIRIMENFNWPIIASNISDFWKRWHMTLAGFCQRYVYMPVIARSRNPYLAIYCTFITMGLWHSISLNYLFWGLYHATGVASVLTFARIKRARGWTSQLKGPFRFWGIPVTFLFVSVSGIFSGTNGLGFSATVAFAAALIGL